MSDEKKTREREILNLVYEDRGIKEAIDAERPDFLLRRESDQASFGVEIAEYFHSETHARLNRIPNYVTGLLDGERFRHKDDIKALDVSKVDILSPDNETQYRGVPAIIQEVPPIAECAQQVASLIHRKTQIAANISVGLRHINLTIRDNTHLLNHVPTEQFYQVYFVQEIVDAIANSPFREIYFVTDLNGELGYVPLNMLYFVSELYLFYGFFSQAGTLPQILIEQSVTASDLFASYFLTRTASPVLARAGGEGVEIIHKDTGLHVSKDNAVAIRMYWDYPLPSDAQPARRELLSLLWPDFSTRFAEYRKNNTFTTQLWFPIKRDSG